jgi:hypothetical protein
LVSWLTGSKFEHNKIRQIFIKYINQSSCKSLKMRLEYEVVGIHKTTWRMRAFEVIATKQMELRCNSLNHEKGLERKQQQRKPHRIIMK